MDLQRAFDEANKRLRTLNDQICCLTDAVTVGTYNSTSTQSLAAGNSTSYGVNAIHSIAWELESGAGLTIDNGVTTPVTYYSNGNIEFSTKNAQSLTLTAVTGGVKLLSIL